jgi:putative DNA primase/helicase
MMPEAVIDGQVTASAPATTTDSGPDCNIAQPWWLAGVSVVPILPGTKKKPSMDWKALQSTPLTAGQVERFWGPGQRLGVAAICGKVSGNLELTELEADAASGADLDKIGAECRLRGIEDLWNSLLSVGYSEWSPSGGIHFLYRVIDHDVPGNTKLAMRLAADNELTEEEQKLRQRNPGQRIWRTRAETRGEGGYVVVAPTPGFCHETGQPWEVMAGKIGVLSELTWVQRQTLHLAITAALDQAPPAPPVEPRREVAVVTPPRELRPGDDWELRHDWDEPWFTDQGWTVSHRVGSETFWVRPGKHARDGHSASTGYNGDKDRLYVWSTSAGLPTEAPLTKFFIYAHYHHSGDMARASSALRRQGFGSPPAVSQFATLNAFYPDPQAAVGLPPQGGLDLTDTGSGRRMKDLYGDRFRYNTRDKFWYEWDKDAGVWIKDEHLSIWRAAVDCAERVVAQATIALNDAEILGDKEEITAAKKRYNSATLLKNKSKIEAAMSMFASEPGISITTDIFDADPDLLNLPNGTLDLVSGELMEHDPANMLTLQMGAKHDKDAEAPLFRQFMIDAFPDDSVRNYVQRAMGYTLLGRPSERTLFLLHGPSGTGKSVFTSVMTEVFGGYGATAPASTFRMKKQSETLDLHKLKGARFVATSEMPEGQQLDEDLVKRISGGDKVSSRGHYEAFTDWKPSCVIWIATNFLPKMSGDDNAIWRRAKSIPMKTEFGTEKSGIDEIGNFATMLIQEADGILNWLLEGLNDYRLNGLAQPPAITADIEAYRIDVNVTASFIRDKEDEGVLIRDEHAETRSSQLRGIFDQYCTENHIAPLGARRWQNQLKALGFEPLKIGGQAWWKGIRINLEHGVLGNML